MRRHLIIAAASLILLSACETNMPEYILPTVETKEAANITSSSAVMQAVFTCDTKTGLYVRRAFELSNDANTLEKNRYYFDDDWTELTGTQNNNAQINGLTASTKYYYRAVLVPHDESKSAPIYGEIKEFTTKAASSQPQKSVTFTMNSVLSTSTTVRIKYSQKASGCTISKVGVVSAPKGVAPTLDNYLHLLDCGNATNFWGFMYNLEPNTTYWIRAYAIDSEKNVYYSDREEITTSPEPGGSKTVNDFIGTYTVSATSPWEVKNVTWTDVQIIPYNGDTVVAVGWEDRDELRAVGIFDKGLQVVRFESGWTFDAYTFDVNGKSCVAQFMPIWYDQTSSKAYLIDTGGKFYSRGEIWMKVNESGVVMYLGAAAGDSDEGYFANGIIFDYYALADWTKQGNSQAYTNVQMNRTKSTTTRALPAGRLRNTNKNKDDVKKLYMGGVAAIEH